jgi:hypothetical protein
MGFMKRVLYLVLAGVAVSFCALTTSAQAQATRTWVSGVGDDANPCSRTAPCKTFAGAISKTTDCGEIDALDPGGFGTLTITKGIKIDGGGGEGGMVASILATGTNGITINNSSTTCTYDVIRNLDINGSGSASVTGLTGINVLNGKNVALENVDVENFTQACINFQPTSIAMNLLMYNTNLENCAGGGIIAKAPTGTDHINVEKSTISRSGVGVTAHSGASINIHNTMVSNNAGGGVLADTNNTAQVTLDLSTVANNQVFGVHATSAGIIRLANTSVNYNNGTGLLADAGGQILTWSNNWVAGNSPDGSRTGTISPM